MVYGLLHRPALPGRPPLPSGGRGGCPDRGHRQRAADPGRGRLRYRPDACGRCLPAGPRARRPGPRGDGDGQRGHEGGRPAAGGGHPRGHRRAPGLHAQQVHDRRRGARLDRLHELHRQRRLSKQQQRRLDPLAGSRPELRGQVRRHVRAAGLRPGPRLGGHGSPVDDPWDPGGKLLRPGGSHRGSHRADAPGRAGAHRLYGLRFHPPDHRGGPPGATSGRRGDPRGVRAGGGRCLRQPVQSPAAGRCGCAERWQPLSDAPQGLRHRSADGDLRIL